MATLKELTQKIVEGDTAILKKQDEGNTKLTSIDAGIRKFLTNIERDKLDQEENRRESNKALGAIAAATDKRAQGWVEAVQGSSAQGSNWIKDILAAMTLKNLAKQLVGLALKITGITAALTGIRNAIDRGLNNPRGTQLKEASGAEKTLREEKLRQRQLEREARERARIASQDAKAAEARVKAARAIQDAEAAEKARVQAERARAKVEAERIIQRAAREAADRAKANEKAAARVRRVANEYKGYGESRREAARIEAERHKSSATSPRAPASTIIELDKVSSKQLAERGFTREYADNGRTRYRDVGGRYVSADNVLRGLGSTDTPASNTSRASNPGANTTMRGLGYVVNPAAQGAFDAAEVLSRTAAGSKVAPVAVLGRLGLGALRVAGSGAALALQFAVYPSDLMDGTVVGSVITPYNDMVNAMMEGKSRSVIISHFDKFKKQLNAFPELRKQFPELFDVAKLTNEQIMTSTSLMYTKNTGKIYTSTMAFGTATGRSTVGVGSVSSSGFGINSAGEISQGAVLSGSELNALDMISEKNRLQGGLLYAPTVNNGGSTTISSGGTSTSKPPTPPARGQDFGWYGGGR